MILYTGATGSIGVDMPKECISMHTRLEQSIEDRKSELKRTLNGPFKFIHLAGLVSVAECEKKSDLAYELNVLGSIKWFQACAEFKCQHFIYVSTSHVYAASDNPLDVNSALNPKSVYAKTKLEAEKQLQQLAKEYKVNLTIARVFSVLSSILREGYLLTRLHKMAQNKDFSPLHGLNYERDFLTSKEVCDKLFKLANQKYGTYGPIVNICSGKPTKIKTILDQVFKNYGLDPSVIKSAHAKEGDVKKLVGVPSL